LNIFPENKYFSINFKFFKLKLNYIDPMINFIIKLYKGNSKRNLTKERYLMNKFVLMNIILKSLTFLPAYYLNKKKISADVITIISYIPIFISAIYFITGYTLLACLFMILSIFLDSLDGDLARLEKNKSKHGSTMDIFGADFFYMLIPVSISYNLIEFQKIDYLFFHEEKIVLLIGFSISLCLIFYRLIGLRNYILFDKYNSINIKKETYKKKFSSFKSLFIFFENDIIRGNFFSEPGFVLNFSILFILEKFQLIYYYLIIILFYLIIRVTKLFVGSILIYIKK